MLIFPQQLCNATFGYTCLKNIPHP